MRVRRRKHHALHRGPAPTPTGQTERWSMDFVHDALADGRPFRILTVIDHRIRVLGVYDRTENGVVSRATAPGRPSLRMGRCSLARSKWTKPTSAVAAGT